MGVPFAVLPHWLRHHILSGAPLLVQGFHGTSVTAAEAALKDGFRVSSNEYDWLGDGVSFFQDAPLRAQEWARSHFGSEACVVEASIALADCMDLLDIRWFAVISDAYDAFLARVKKTGMSFPRQTAGAHRLDRYLINYVVTVLAGQGIGVRCVRAAFTEGAPVVPNSALFDRAHVQIAVRDTSLILNPRIHHP